MKVSLCGAGLGASGYSLLQFIELASRHGFDGVDFGMGGVLKAVEEMGLRQFEEYLAEKGVALAVFGLPVEWRRDEATFEQGMTRLAEEAQMARTLGVTRCVTWMLPATSLELEEWRRQTVRRLSEIARVLDDNGVRFGLEWVGPHHLRAGGANATGTTNTVYNMAQTQELIANIGVPSVGLLVDSYHCYTTGVTEEEIASLRDQDIVHVHINDARRGVPVEEVRDSDRILPGEGAIDLASFLNGLRRAGYAGYVSCEVLAPQPIADNPDTAAERVRESLRALGL